MAGPRPVIFVCDGGSVDLKGVDSPIAQLLVDGLLQPCISGVEDCIWPYTSYPAFGINDLLQGTCIRPWESAGDAVFLTMPFKVEQ